MTLPEWSSKDGACRFPWEGKQPTTYQHTLCTRHALLYYIFNPHMNPHLFPFSAEDNEAQEYHYGHRDNSGGGHTCSHSVFDDKLSLSPWVMKGLMCSFIHFQNPWQQSVRWGLRTCEVVGFCLWLWFWPPTSGRSVLFFITSPMCLCGTLASGSMPGLGRQCLFYSQTHLLPIACQAL